MSTGSSCESLDNSFFLIDRKYQLTSFKAESFNFLGSFLEKNPSIGEQIVEMVTQEYRDPLLGLLTKCFSGDCFSIEQRLPVANANDHMLLITFTPIREAVRVKYVACTVFNDSINARQFKLLNEYSHLTSHQLRAPITNILSLSNITNHSSFESYDILKVNELMGEINKQAEKLDGIIRMLNSLLHEDENMSFKPGMVGEKSKHIVLVDDDVITNKIHQMLISKLQMDKRVVLFEKPEYALNYIIEHAPDLILLDLHMPEIDGWKFLQRLEEYHIHADVIIVSSSIDPAERSRAQKFMCVKDFVTKPLTYEKVKLIFDN
eukprot:gene10079-11755_t